jgi:hypothetical protein
MLLPDLSTPPEIGFVGEEEKSYPQPYNKCIGDCNDQLQIDANNQLFGQMDLLAMKKPLLIDYSYP